jgi:hypothetical protein
MANKKIGQLPTLTAITENTLFVVENSGTTYNIEYSTIKPYKVYTALLNTEDISNPIVLENTLGSDILWAIGGGGYQYNGAVDNDCFTENKTIGFSYSGGDAEDTYYGFIVQRTGISEIRIFNTSVDLIHVKIRVEIKVYN